LRTIFEAFPLDPGSMQCFARNDKGEKSKEAQLIFSWVTLIENGLKQLKCEAFRAFSGNTLQLTSSIE